MGNIRQRVAMLEKVAVPAQTFGTHSLEIDVRGERCDVVLQRELEKKGICLDEVNCLSIIGDTHTRHMSDFQNHPKWELLQKLNDSARIFMMVIVQDKEEWAQYQRAKQEEQ